jgi:hypothetical protein
LRPPDSAVKWRVEERRIRHRIGAVHGRDRHRHATPARPPGPLSRRGPLEGVGAASCRGPAPAGWMTWHAGSSPAGRTPLTTRPPERRPCGRPSELGAGYHGLGPDGAVAVPQDISLWPTDSAWARTLCGYLEMGTGSPATGICGSDEVTLRSVRSPWRRRTLSMSRCWSTGTRTLWTSTTSSATRTRPYPGTRRRAGTAVELFVSSWLFRSRLSSTTRGLTEVRRGTVMTQIREGGNASSPW